MRNLFKAILTTSLALILINTSKAQLATGWPSTFKKYYTQRWTGQWDTFTRNAPAFNNDKTLRSILFQQKNNSTYVNTEKDTFFYAGGKLNEKIHQTVVFGKWNNSTKLAYTYDAKGKIAIIKNAKWNSGAWAPLSKDSNVYDANGKISFIINMSYTNGKYINKAQTTICYNVGGQIICKDLKTWNGSTWVPSNREVFSYNKGGQVTDVRAQVYTGGIYVDQTKYVFEYEAPATITDIEETTSTHQIKTLQVYPNPAHDFVTIILGKNETASEFTLHVFDMQGKEIRSQKMNETNTYNISDMQNGIYIMQCTDGVNIYTSRIVKN